MASSLLFNIDNLNVNILQDSGAINRVVPPPLSLVLSNRITMKFNLIVQLRATTRKNSVLNFDCIYSQLVDTSANLNIGI